MKLLVSLLCLMFAVGCGRARSDTPTFVYRGVEVYMDSTKSAAAHNPDVEGQIAHIIDVSVAYWGSDTESLSKYQVTFTDEPTISCGPWPFKVSHNVIGCTESNIFMQEKQIIVSLHGLDWIGESCFPHEVGHTITTFGDTLHEDNRFRGFSSIWDDLTQNCSMDPYTHTEEDSIRWNACTYTHPGFFWTWRADKGDWWDYVPDGDKIRKLF